MKIKKIVFRIISILLVIVLLYNTAIIIRYNFSPLSKMEVSDTANAKTITIRDGRILGYMELGSHDGRPLLYFHGHPGSRYEAKLLEEHAIELNIRLIAIDRPGYGLSTYKSGRTILDRTDDIIELADQLRIHGC